MLIGTAYNFSTFCFIDLAGLSTIDGMELSGSSWTFLYDKKRLGLTDKASNEASFSQVLTKHRSPIVMDVCSLDNTA